MVAKTTGVEFKRFYNDVSIWPDGAWHEDALILVNDQNYEDDLGSIPDAAKVTIEGGEVLYHGPDEECPWKGNEGPSVETHFKRWRKKQATGTAVIEFDLGKRDAVIAAVVAAGGKVAK